MEIFYIYLVAALLLGWFIYRLVRFVKRKIRWFISSLPMMFLMGNVPTQKWQHVLNFLS